MEVSVHGKCPAVDNCIPRVWKHDGHSRAPGVLTGVADQQEDQWSRLIPSEIAGDRVMGKSEGSDGFFMAVNK